MGARLGPQVAVHKGQEYLWNGVRCVVLRASQSGAWADLSVTSGLGSWTKRQPLPLPEAFVLVAGGEA